MNEFNQNIQESHVTASHEVMSEKEMNDIINQLKALEQKHSVLVADRDRIGLELKEKEAEMISVFGENWETEFPKKLSDLKIEAGNIVQQMETVND